MEADAPRFLTQVRCITANLIRISHPKEVFVTRIDEWFDHRFQKSAANMNRCIDRVSTSGVFLWFSGGAAKTGNGSLLVYTSTGERQHGWYASFRGLNDWQLHKVRGLSRVELVNLMENNLERESPNPWHISTPADAS